MGFDHRRPTKSSSITQRQAAATSSSVHIGSHRGTSPAQLLQLQQSAGNRAAQLMLEAGPTGERDNAVLQRKEASSPPSAGGGGSSDKGVVQRLPTRKQMEAELKPKKDSFFKKNSTRVKGFLGLLDHFNMYVQNTEVGATAVEIKGQLERIKQLYSAVENSAKLYVASKKQGSKNDAMQAFLSRLQRERALIILKANEYMMNPPSIPPKWYLTIAGMRGMQPVTTNESLRTGESGSGAINTVEFLNMGDHEAVFKSDKQQLSEEDNATEFFVATEQAGINANDAHMANRNVAASRLDKLLGANVIAYAEHALHSGGGASVSGSIMDKADGKQAGKFDKTTISLDDPELQRSLSRLQLMDILSMQVDRHGGNYFVQTAPSGEVLGVTGIDNDMAFGERVDIEKQVQEFPGFSKFVDKELAERIIALVDSDVAAVVADLLSASEINALLTRLAKLKAKLSALQSENKLLEREDWGKEITPELLKERTNYLAELNWKMSKT